MQIYEKPTHLQKKKKNNDLQKLFLKFRQYISISKYFNKVLYTIN